MKIKFVSFINNRFNIELDHRKNENDPLQKDSITKHNISEDSFYKILKTFNTKLSDDNFKDIEDMVFNAEREAVNNLIKQMQKDGTDIDNPEEEIYYNTE